MTKPAERSTRISADEAAYLRAVRAEAVEAQGYERRAGELEAEAAQLRARATALYGAHESYIKHLCTTYGLDAERDSIDPKTSEITRAAADSSPADGPPVNGLAQP